MMARPSNHRKGNSGVVRRVDPLGRIVIPSEIRKRFGIAERDPLEISMSGDAIVLARPASACVFCDRNEPLTEYRGRPVCVRCVAELSEL
jgi:transcriptional pleiotropic regulator of transition state genes